MMNSPASRRHGRPPQAAHAARRWLAVVSLAATCAAAPAAEPLKLDERPADAREWGHRPAEGSTSPVNPPSFSWRPQKDLTYEIQCCRGTDFKDTHYRAEGLAWNVHCPPRTFPPGRYTWRYRGRDARNRTTNWSRPRTFTVPDDAARLPLPPREELLGRIPKSHPRLFVRPERLEGLRELARGKLKAQYAALLRRCDRLLAKPPSTSEPPKYPSGMERGSDAWREIWWGNRRRVIAALGGAATLGFAHRLGGKATYGTEAKRLLLACAKWDPTGSTGYRYNDEAGMPYAYYFSRAYTFVHDLLSAAERRLCRRVMQARGDEMYRHLCPRHFWRPYSSHANRAWHFLGEVGIAFLGEIPAAADWVWFAANVFFNVYPVWSDAAGGWHEGSSYWASYQGRFTWWADVMRQAMGIDAYAKPYYANAGYYCMYLMPPGKVGGGFGDLTAKKRSDHFRRLMTTLAAQAGNVHWQWWLRQVGGPAAEGGYIGFVRGALPAVAPRPPDDLPSSRCFAGTGQAVLNSDLTDARRSVQVVFKSSPFGTQSHGYEANNSFLLWGWGKRLLIRTGRRDSYGSKHHRRWMWSTQSVNCITVNGHGQVTHSARAAGRIAAFRTTPAMDVVVGEAGSAYAAAERDARGRVLRRHGLLDRFSRAILFVKPNLVIVYDRLVAKEPSTFEYWLHAINKIAVEGPRRLRVRNGEVRCDVEFLAPAPVRFTQTDQYDPNPRPRIKLREWHLTAATTKKQRRVEFVTLYCVRPSSDAPAATAELKGLDGGYVLSVSLAGARLLALLPADDEAVLEADGLRGRGELKARLSRPNRPPALVTVRSAPK
jgi:hypothetical protein